MFAHVLSLHLKPTTHQRFHDTLATEVLPILQRHDGFRNEITLTDASGNGVTAISLWDSKAQADCYELTGYPEVLELLDPLMDGRPTVSCAHAVYSASMQVTAH
jgi:hypothetical protein